MKRTSFQMMLMRMASEVSGKSLSKKAGVYIFGTGQGGKATYNHLKSNAYYEDGFFNIRGFFDNNPLNHGLTIDNIKVFSPNINIMDPSDFVIIASHSHQYDMEDQLLEMGIDKKKIIYPGKWLNEVLTDKEAMLIEEKPIFCPCCQEDTWVVSELDKEYYFCVSCRSFPWHRAIIKQINELIGDDISQKSLYEVAPQGSSSIWLEEKAGTYTGSHYWTDIPFGSRRGKLYSQDLEALTFPNGTFDIVVSQVVFEHIFNPEKAFMEIGRVLKKGGVHVFTIPFFPNTKTVTRAIMNQAGEVEHLKEPIYHGNPISADGALVTFDWGEDIVELIHKWTGMVTEIYVEEEEYSSGVTAFSHVFVSRKE